MSEQVIKWWFSQLNKTNKHFILNSHDVQGNCFTPVPLGASDSGQVHAPRGPGTSHARYFFLVVWDSLEWFNDHD